MKKPDLQKKTFFQRFGLFFYDRLKTTSAIWLALVIFGALSYTVLMQRQGFPNVDVPISVTSGGYFVNDKIAVDQKIVKPFSAIAVKRPNVKTVTSTAGANFFSIVIEYDEGTNVGAAQSGLKEAVKTAGFFPQSATLEYRAINASKIDNRYDVLLSVRRAPDSSLAELTNLADKAALDIKTTDGVLTAQVLEPFKTGVSPETGQSVSVQQSFDRVGGRENGKTIFYPSVEIGIVAKNGTDAIHLERALNERLESLNRKLESTGTKVAISAGVAESVESQISGLQTNLLEGLVIVIIISLLLISLRAGLATALSMASVLLITVGVLYLLGITLNTITLFALVLCLGLIVDDTTIMAEAIDAGKKANASSREIVAMAMKKVARASTAGTIVTMLAFTPMLFISGILGSFIRVLPITIITSLAVSLLVSLTLIPFMSRWLLLSAKNKAARSRNPVLRVESWLSDGLAALIRVGNRSRSKAVAIGLAGIALSLVLLIFSGVYFQKLKFDIFPSTKDSDALMLSITYPAGTDISAAEKITDKADERLSKSLGANIRDVTYLNSGGAEQSSAMIRLISFKQRAKTSPELIKAANETFQGFSEARIKISQSDAGPPKDDLPFRVQIFGEDTKRTDKLAKDMAAFLQDRKITRTTNKTTALITRVRIAGDAGSVTRKDARRLIEVLAGFDSDDTSALVTSAQKTLQDEFTDSKIASYGIDAKSVSYDFGNESDNQDSFKSMLLAFPVLLVVMYLLLAFQFRSLLQPLLIFTAIPFSFFGVAAGLYYTDNPLSFFVMIGFFALIGIAVNNTILLTDFANQARKEGNGGFESMALAVKARFRPLLATSITSVVALLPLALSDPFWESLAYTLIFGLLSSTLLVIVAFPYFYLGAELLRSRYSRRLTIAWLLALMALIVIAGRIKASYVPVIFPLFAVAMLTTWLKGKYQKRLHGH